MKNIYKTIIFLLNFIFCHLNSFSQTAPGIQWQKTIGGSDADQLYSIQQTADGGYILGGYSLSNISGNKTENCIGDKDYWIVKTDSAGNILWQNTIGGSDIDELFSIQQTADGGYILGGYSLSDISGDKTENSNGGFDYWIVKTDSAGNILWQNTIGGIGSEELHSMQQTADGGYIVSGSSNSNISGDKTENCLGGTDYWIVKTDSLGIIQWDHTIGGSDVEGLYSIQQTADGGYILGGFSLSNISGNKTENSNGGFDYWIVKTDSAGIIEWQNTIGGSAWDAFNSIQQTTDGGYILGGYTSSDISGDKTENSNGAADYWILKTDLLGNIQWQNSIGGLNNDVLWSVRQTTDGGYIIGGWSASNISGDKTENSNGIDDYWVVKTDSLGIVQWDNTLGGITSDDAMSVMQTIDGGYIIGGFSNSTISGDKTENCIGELDYWIIKLAPDTVTSIFYFQYSTINIQIFPNPLTTQSKLTFKNPNKDKFLFTLYDITGRITESMNTATEEIILTKGNKQPGIYLFNLTNEKTGERWNGKILITN